MKDLSAFLYESIAETEENESITEGKVDSEESFREYAENKLKKAHGDDYDEDKAKKTIDGILDDNKELVDDGDWGALVGILNKGIAN